MAVKKGNPLDEQLLRSRFVHDFQYRYHKQSDHYTIVAKFAKMVAEEAIERERRGERHGPEQD